MIWRENRILLGALAILLAANTFFFFTYRVQYEARLDALDSRLDVARAQLEASRAARRAAEQQVAAYRKIDRDVRDVLQQRWSTEEERLTSVIGEVKRLTAAAGLAAPQSTSYSRAEGRSRIDAGTGATEVGLAFTVRGTYQNIRRFINLLEISDQFIIVDRLGLSSAEADQLTMNIHIKTLFRDTAPPVQPPSNRQL
jgi:hypothetical protein